MAYYFGEEDKENNSDQVDASKPSSVIPAGNVSPNVPANASVNNARTNPGNFVGISQYLDANKPQSSALANQVGGVVTGAADEARKELQQKSSDARNQIKTNTVDFDQNAINQLNTDASKADVAKIEAMKNASYKGPQTLGNIDSLTRAQQAAANTDTEEGRQSLVSDLYKDQPLKKGALTFDNLLLQAAPEAKNILANAKSKANVTGLESDIAAQRKSIEDAAKKAAETTNKTAADTRQAIGSAKTGFEGGLQSRVDQLRNQATQESQGALDRLRAGGGLSGVPSARDLELLGINEDQYRKLVDSGTAGSLAGQAVMRDASGINAGNVASAEDYARYNVLKRLAEGGDFLGDDASQAGKYNTDLLDFNYVEPPAPKAPPPTVPVFSSGPLMGTPAGETGIGVNAPGESDPNKASILRNPDGTPVLEDGQPYITESPAPKAKGSVGEDIAKGTKEVNTYIDNAANKVAKSDIGAPIAKALMKIKKW